VAGHTRSDPPPRHHRLAPSATGDYPRYLAVYEFRNPQDFEAWFSGEEMKAAAFYLP
jgi:heme-degrading monooxygenase HmoA